MVGNAPVVFFEHAEVVRPEVRAALDAHVLERVRGMKLERNRVTAADLCNKSFNQRYSGNDL